MRVILAKGKEESVILPALGTPVKDVWILAFNVNIPLIKKEGDPTTNIGLEIETSNSDNFLESDENCSGTIHPSSFSQTNNFTQLNDLANNFSFTNSSLQLNYLRGSPQVNDFSFTNGFTQENDFSFMNITILILI
ncbi:hypothetical protein Glove_144g142 [Diversispora epigaea]|uniref:Uncharacterized protein n=1 Tax=Diversispora epigaea TaxID=1348612 RepID=A0A397IU39_9GLOM|nr:hypothetical protein Glove_144g142 [Diversispora epigaea]